MKAAKLTELIRASETPDGAPAEVIIPGGAIWIESVYISGNGPHRAWKRLYYLTLNGKKMGGYDRRDSFVQWAARKLKDVA